MARPQPPHQPAQPPPNGAADGQNGRAAGDAADPVLPGGGETGLEPKKPGERTTVLLRFTNNTVLVSVLAILTALIVGAIIILASGKNPLAAYSALVQGAFYTPNTPTGQEFKAIANTLFVTTPYIFGALAVATAFNAGMFNIGVAGQVVIGGICATVVGYSFGDLPGIIHVPLALLAGCIGGAFWAGIAGFLKARTGAHEVITTIMLNYVAYSLSSYLIQHVLNGGKVTGLPKSLPITSTAHIPHIFEQYQLHWGFVLALLVAFGIYYLLKKMTLGFELRTVGQNPAAARYAGINVTRTTVVAMLLSGALASFVGSADILGQQYYYSDRFGASLGFDAIAVSLLARNNPLAILPAAFMFGILRSGSSYMQLQTDIPVDLIGIIQALVLLFVSATEIVRFIYRLPKSSGMAGAATVVRGWGKSA